MHEDWHGEARAKIEIELTTLDREIQQYGIPDYCKIDVEGWEYQVLLGLTQPIPLLSFEYHLNDTDIAKTRQCLEYLAQYHYPVANLRETGASSFLLDHFIPIQKIIDRFPSQIPFRSKTDYGEIFVKNNL